ncbi:MAG: DUF1501 domain-containing protein [Archangium sp.]|nr:DUF1501 domain-containing protein [Archangium sp.]
MNFSRRSLLKGAAGLAGAGLFAGPSGLIPSAWGQAAPQKSAVLMVFLRGGYNALFSNADSFAPAGTFGVTGSNTRNLGSGLVIDAPTYGTLPALALSNMAAIGVNHGISSHDPARMADWSNGTKSYALMLANALGGTAAIKCAVVGGNFPDGPRPAENGVSMQSITDMTTTINALGGGTTDPTIPDRAKAAAALGAARTMSAAQLSGNESSLASVKDAYDSSIAVLQSNNTLAFNPATVAAAYGLPTNTRAVNSFTAQMMAAELMVLAGTNVVCAVNNGWDTHGDRTGSVVRQRMTDVILPGLRTFTQRMMSQGTRNITVAVFGDFSRSLPGSDHARCLGATVWGTKVRLGVSGKVAANVGMPTANPAGQAYSAAGFWSYLAATSKAPTNPFGANPHSALVLP